MLFYILFILMTNFIVQTITSKISEKSMGKYDQSISCPEINEMYDP